MTQREWKFAAARAIMGPMWQDYVIAACIIVFIVALIPSVRGDNKPELSSSLTTAAVQIVLSVTYVTLHLWFSVATGLVLFSLWATLAVQQWRRRNDNRFYVSSGSDEFTITGSALAGTYELRKVDDSGNRASTSTAKTR